MIHKTKCILCGTEILLEVNEDDLKRYKNAGLLMDGLCQVCFNKLYEGSEENE